MSIAGNTVKFNDATVLRADIAGACSQRRERRRGVPLRVWRLRVSDGSSAASVGAPRQLLDFHVMRAACAPLSRRSPAACCSWRGHSQLLDFARHARGVYAPVAAIARGMLFLAWTQPSRPTDHTLTPRPLQRRTASST